MPQTDKLLAEIKGALAPKPPAERKMKKVPCPNCGNPHCGGFRMVPDDG